MKSDISKQAGERARELFGSGWFCAESVLRAMAEAGGKYTDGLEALASGMCAGVARTDNICGAVSGAVMGLGLYVGRTDPGAGQTTDLVNALAQEFMERFKAEWSETTCTGLSGYNFSEPGGLEQFRKAKRIEKCFDVADFAASCATGVLVEHGFLSEQNIRERIVRAVAPCGLSCEKCIAFAEGEVRSLSRKLAERLGPNFHVYAERFSAVNPAMAKYAEFREMLEYLASGQCTGCRGQGCLFLACKVPECARSHDVGFCFECSEFPCERHGMPPGLAERWQKNNEIMRDKGLEAYERLVAERHRYP